MKLRLWRGNLIIIIKQMTTYIKQNQMYKINKTDFVIDEVYPAYRQGWTVFKKWNCDFATYKKVEGEWKKEEWQKDSEGNNKKVLVSGEIDMKVHKKVYDVKITLEKEIEVEAYDKKAKKDLPILTTEIVIQWVGAAKVAEMVKSILEEVPEVVERNWQEYDVFDWEEEHISKLKGKYVRAIAKKVTKDLGNWPISYYEFTFKDWKAPSINIEDIPF